MNLLQSFGKRGVKYNLLSQPVDVIDSYFLSKYFVVSDFNPTFTSGKNSLSINGSAQLKPDSEIFVECLDSNDNNLFIDIARVGDTTNPKSLIYKEANSQILSIHVYGDTADGLGKLILYGILVDGKRVRWIGNINIDKTRRNISKVRFFDRPLLEVNSILLPVFDDSTDNSVNGTINFIGQFHSIALNPSKDILINSINKKLVDIDYRINIDASQISSTTDNSGSFNKQMVDSSILLTVNKIQEPFSNKEIALVPPQTQSFIIKDIVTNTSLKISDPYSFTDGRKNDLVTNITSGSFTVSYPFVGYNTSTSSYLTTSFAGEPVIIKKSYADIVYRNIRTFSGYVARQKVYRRSLLSKVGFELIADEPITINELLKDNNTKNIFYDRLGIFYNPSHIQRYWFTSSNNIFLTHTPDKYINSMKIDGADVSSITGSYVIVKNDSVPIQRNSTYVPFNQNEFNDVSGSSYDANFIDLKEGVQYILSTNAFIEKNIHETNAKVTFYITSSTDAAAREDGFSGQYGIKIAELTASNLGPTKNFTDQIFFYTPKSDIFGTMVIVPNKCKVTLQNISFRVFGDDGFSPDVYSTRIPWNISVAGENFEIKAELFDINSNLVYSNLHLFQNFDPDGTSLIPFIPGSGDIEPGDLFVKGKLIVSKSIFVQTGDIVIQQSNLFIPNITTCTGSGFNISASRFTTWRDPTGVICLSKLADVTHTNQYIFVSTGSNDHNAVNFSTQINTRKSLTTEYDVSHGRRVYISGGTINIENGST